MLLGQLKGLQLTWWQGIVHHNIVEHPNYHSYIANVSDMSVSVSTKLVT